MPETSATAALPIMPPKQARRNELMNYIQLMWATPYVVILQQYIPVLATRLGASALLLGVLSSGAALMMTLAAFLSRWWLKKSPPNMRSIVIPVIGARSVILWVPIVLLLADPKAEWLVAGTIISNFFLGFVSVAFLSVLPRLTYPDRVSSMVSGRWTVLGVGMVIGVPLMASVLDAFPMPTNYIIVCCFATLTSIGEFITFLQWKPRLSITPPRPTMSIRTDFALIWQNIPSRRYLIISLLAQLGLNSLAPLVPLQIIRHLGATNLQFGWYSTVLWLAIAVTGLIRPWLIQRFGNGRLYALALIGMALEALTLGMATNLPMTWLAGAIGGISLGLFQVTAFGLIVESAPEGHYESFVSIQTGVANFALFVSPLLTSGLTSVGLPIAITLLLSSSLRATAGVLAYNLLYAKTAPKRMLR
jgi:MFS family permease